MADTRKHAIARVTLYAERQGDRVVVDPGYTRHDALLETFRFGAVDHSGARPLLELLDLGDDRGAVVNRPRLVPQDTRSPDFFFTGGTWVQERAGFGPRVYFLSQVDTSPDIVYAAASNYPLPADPECCWVLFLPDTPPDWDSDLYPPYVRIELQGWAVHLEKGGAFLLQDVAGIWQAARELPNPPRGSGYTDGQAIELRLRVVRGRIGISFDGGQAYSWYGDGSLAIAAGGWTLRGQGGQVTCGLWQLRPEAGVYTAQREVTGPLPLAATGGLALRLVSTPTITGKGRTVDGAAITFADDSDTYHSEAGYRATLTPAVVETYPWQFWRSPELYAVSYDLPVLSVVTGTEATVYTKVLAVEPDKPHSLDEATFTVRLHRSAFTAVAPTSYRRRKVKVELGHTDLTDTEVYQATLVGYVRESGLDRSEFGCVDWALHCDNPSVRFKTPWGPFQRPDLSGLTANQAADKILAARGLDHTYRSWDAQGDFYVLDVGTPEEPLRPPAEETPWESLKNIFGLAGLELGVEEAGTFRTVPRWTLNGPYTTAISHTKTLTPTDLNAVRELVLGAGSRVDYSEMATLVIVTGEAEDGGALAAWAPDDGAEGLVAGRRTLWREVFLEQVRGKSTLGTLAGRAIALARELFHPKVEPEIEVPVDITMGRRDQLVLYGAASLEIPDGTAFVILTLRHSYRAGEALGSLTTSAGLWKLQ